ncbi:hypothetical protein B0H15DRAFT_853162 [Mycena belliarum]|uniref:Zn(2)-C6 fungal-type domain-containing protein n=1 Tax=Mycena belliarum TaxID=1033014 RepID=A0AAD6TZP1_9AGAR|nr:hypothetical protein B0H15DRAFT_853162 [Mycena belliae]
MDAKLKTPTCLRCKMRKIRCDGQSVCNTCSAMGAQCEYDEETADERPVLRKGAACTPCRRKKKKCDGRLPCSTCASSRKNVPCEYPDGPSGETSEIGATSRIPADIDGLPSTSGTSTLPNIPGIFVDLSENLSEIEVSEANAAYVTLADLARAREVFVDGYKRGADADKLRLTVTEDEDMGTEPLPGRFFDAAATFQSPIPDESDEDLPQTRQLFLNHRIQLGLSTPDCVLQAISQGETGDGMLHPLLLHACQLMGYMLGRHLQSNIWLFLPGQSAREAEQMRLALTALQPSAPPACTIAYLQTTTLLALYFFNKGDLVGSRSTLAKGAELVATRDLDAPLLDPVASPDNAPLAMGFKTSAVTRAAEAQAAFAQLVYLDLCQMITLKLPPVLDAPLYAKFRALVNAPNPNAEINFVRAKSAFLLHTAQALAAVWHHAQLDDVKAAQWQKCYWALLEKLDAHRSDLAGALTRVAFCTGLHALARALKLCTVLTLTALALLLALFAARQPELARRQYDALSEAVSISASFSDADCAHLDAILSACWPLIVETLEQCIALKPEARAQCVCNLPAMVRMVRERNKALHRAVPFVLDM